MRIAAIDQGTTSTRVLVVEDNGDAAIAHAVQHKQSHPFEGWVEHDPEELLANIETCLKVADRVDLIGIDNQGESCLAWDAITKRALSPVIVWQDNRTIAETERLKSLGLEMMTKARAGLPLDPYFSASKLAWALNNIPAVQEAHVQKRLRLGTSDAFFLDRLTGQFATDVTTASRTSLMNIESRLWDAELCALFGVPMECLPEIRPSIGDFGRWRGIPVTASVVDQQAALYGHGCRKAGDAKITFGTGAFTLVVTGPEILRAAEIGILPTVAWTQENEATYAIDGGVYDAGAAVEWAMRVGIISDVSELGHFTKPCAIERNIAFVPALSGLACPHWDRSATGVFIGLTHATTREDMQQAILEGIALRTAEVIEAMGQRIAISNKLSVDGGLSRSRYFVQFLANELEREISTSTFDERTAYGTAGLAACALNLELALPANTATETFKPMGIDRAKHRAKFSDAVHRAKKWQ